MYLILDIDHMLLNTARFKKALSVQEERDIIANFSKWDLLKLKEIIGVFEILSVVLLWFTRTNLYGVISLSFIMIGAIYTHVTHSEPYFFNLAIILVLWINYLFVKPKKQIQE